MSAFSLPEPAHPNPEKPKEVLPMSFAEDFKKFAFKGNVVDLAVGVIIGAAFGKIVSALVADIVMPVIAFILPSGDWRASGLVLRHADLPKDDVVLKYGDFLGAVVDFLVVALVLFILVSRLIKAVEERLARPSAVEPAPVLTKECVYCLESIPVKATRCRACTSEVP
jgi:large conductance mechanosensitive channel